MNINVIVSIVVSIFLFLSCNNTDKNKATQVANDVTTPLHLMQPDYPVPYGETTPQSIKVVLDRVVGYLETATPKKIIDKVTGSEIIDFTKTNENAVFEPGEFRMVSYEWGVTYAGMMNVYQQTNDDKYLEYVTSRMQLLEKAFPGYLSQVKANSELHTPIQSVLKPHALDDAGAMCAAMIKAQSAGYCSDLSPMINNYIDYISTKEFRLNDGTLARNRPLPNTIWLDDLFMSVPALAQMGKFSGDYKYFDDAVKQVLKFSQRMFDDQKGLYMHGWVQDMDPHPAFHWARANGWAFMTLAELLDVLSLSHPHYNAVMELYKKHASGLVSYQDGTGFWHQLIDRNDTYLETSATAIYTYALAKGINNGWIDAKTFGPATLLAWNAVATKVNQKGQVEGTCVGTGMGFDPAFYYYRPINVFAAHGYGPVLLAGSEMMKLLKKKSFVINDSAVMF